MQQNDRDIESVSCASSSYCVAIDAYGNSFPFTGGSWSTRTPVGGGGLRSLSCPSASDCVAVDHNGRAVTYNGTTWSTPSTIDHLGFLMSVSCPSSAFCMAVDTQGHAVSYSGSSWSAPTSIDAGASLVSVSCPSSTFCAAVDGNGYALTYNGTSWSTPVGIDTNPALSGLSAVSCASASFCVAVDGSGNAITYNGASWSAPTSIDDNQAIIFTSVSCPSASFCVAIGATFANSAPEAVTYNGSTWSTPVGVAGAGAVSCASATFCGLVDASFGQASTYNGSSWSTPASLDSSGLNEISCPTDGACTALDQENAFTYSTAGTTPPPDTTPPTIAFQPTTWDGPNAIISAAITDNVGVASEKFQVVNGQHLGTGNQSGDVYSVYWNTATVPNGTYTVSVSATDTSGNSATNTEQITVNNAVSGCTGSSSIPKGLRVVGKYLEWNPVACAAYYQVEIKTGNGSWRPWAKTNAADANSTQALIKKPGSVPDSYRVGAEGADSAPSAYSASVTIPAAAPGCVVPKLKGKTLAQAKRALKTAHCQLGKVKQPTKAKKGAKLMVTEQSPAARKRLPSGSKVGITLAAARKR